MDAYKGPLPAANPNPPLRAKLVAELDRRRQAKEAKAAKAQSPPQGAQSGAAPSAPKKASG
jgi:hypothetical protein